MTTSEPTTEIINHVCMECGFVGGATAINGKVKCPSCGTVNDVWLLGETPPPTHRENEPTTGEIVRALRKGGCFYGLSRLAADRLESQERKIADIENFHKEMLKDHKAHVAALTARAEQAERERDAAVEHVHDAIFRTNHSCFYCTMENCDGCTNSTVKEHFKYRGLQPNKYLVKSEESGKENG